jgi:hypothetical protein
MMVAMIQNMSLLSTDNTSPFHDKQLDQQQTEFNGNYSTETHSDTRNTNTVANNLVFFATTDKARVYDKHDDVDVSIVNYRSYVST